MYQALRQLENYGNVLASTIGTGQDIARFDLIDLRVGMVVLRDHHSIDL